MLSDEPLAHSFLIIVQETKLEVVNLILFIEVNLVKKESVVRQGQTYPHLTHPLHKLPEVKRSIEVLIKSSESLGKALKLLNDPVIDML